jgi:glycosyltransferase involved in cell wall biosynthesis
LNLNLYYEDFGKFYKDYCSKKHMSKSKEEKISAVIICYNDGEIIKKALKSLKGVVDEIIVIHDGPCLNKTLSFAKKYTQNIYEFPRKGRASLHLIDAMKKSKNDWILKIDTDEFLSKNLRENIRKLAQNKKVSAYFFRWLIWNGKKYVTKNWPHKKAMFRKSKVNFYEFPGRDEPNTFGESIKTNYLLEHRPKEGKNDALWTWKEYWKKALNRYGKSQAKWTLKEFKSLRKWNCKRKNYPLAIRIRRKFPLLSAIPFGIFAFFKGILSKGAWKEKKFFIFRGAFQTGLYYIWLGWYMHNLKRNKKELFSS